MWIKFHCMLLTQNQFSFRVSTLDLNFNVNINFLPVSCVHPSYIVRCQKIHPLMDFECRWIIMMTAAMQQRDWGEKDRSRIVVVRLVSVHEGYSQWTNNPIITTQLVPFNHPDQHGNHQGELSQTQEEDLSNKKDGIRLPNYLYRRTDGHTLAKCRKFGLYSSCCCFEVLIHMNVH
jgi:hypothetical protein